MNKNELADYVHMEIHALRRINAYKPSNAEINISKKVIETFSNSCSECRERKEQNKNKTLTPKKGIFNKITEVLEEDAT